MPAYDCIIKHSDNLCSRSGSKDPALHRAQRVALYYLLTLSEPSMKVEEIEVPETPLECHFWNIDSLDNDVWSTCAEVATEFSLASADEMYLEYGGPGIRRARDVALYYMELLG